MGNTLPSAATGTALSTETETSWGLPARQSLVRSNAFSLLANGAEADEIATALAGQHDVLREAIAGWQAQCEPLRAMPTGQLAQVIQAEIGGFVALTGGGWMPAHRQEFIDQCLLEFADLPHSVVIPAIRQARRKVFEPKRFVSWVFEFIEKDLNRLEAEGKQLGELAGIAGI